MWLATFRVVRRVWNSSPRFSTRPPQRQCKRRCLCNSEFTV